MYSLQWAYRRVQELFEAHTRATEFLLEHLALTPKGLAHSLAASEPEWEYFKYLIRMVENAWGIRGKPNTTERLYSKQACAALTVCLQSNVKNTPEWLLTARTTYWTLKKHCVCAAGARTLANVGPLSFDNGQLSIFTGGSDVNPSGVPESS